ncbi:MAG: DUF2520 domain-containing protein [Rhodocyclaceae bacterium]|nr:DUF2520 domain-containing protein [Rhodocyclaceae bacterium]
MEKPRINLVGCGRVARSLGRLWSSSGTLAIGGLYSRSASSARSAAEFIGAGRPCDRLAEIGTADLWLIATPDSALAVAASALAAEAPLRDGDCVFHCSGACTSELLAPARAAGAMTASAHPVLSFAVPEAACRGFSGSHVGIEGELAAIARLERVFTAIGASCFTIDARHKMLYHAGSVFASNFTVVLLDVALQCYRSAGIEPETAAALMRPLVEAAIGNALRAGPAAALSGPAARGDLELVARQRQAVGDWAEDPGRAYEVLSRLAIELAARAPR